MPVKLTDSSKITFGAHNGKTLASIPDSYFYWLNNQKWFKKNTPLGEYIKENWDAILKNTGNKK